MPEAPNTADVRALSFAALTNLEITAIWDNAMGPERSSETSEDRHVRAAKTWREINARMTPEQRQECHLVVIQDSWPQWVLQRTQGRFGTTWERKRDQLIEGLNARHS